jgi:Na+-driven multidrug efflux pump
MPARAGESMLRRLLNISGPFFLGSLARLSVTICTTVLVGRIGSSVQLAAIGFATVMCNITGHSMVQGMGAALDTLSSQAFGAGQVPKLGMLAQRSFAISLCMVCLPASILWIAIGPLMRSAGMDAELADQVGQFALWRIPGLVTQCAYVSLAKTLNAQRMTKPGAQAPSLYHAVFLPPLRFFTFTYLKVCASWLAHRPCCRRLLPSHCLAQECTARGSRARSGYPARTSRSCTCGWV